MLRHVIVEGMDGTGKTGLVTAILDSALTFTMHERASTSTGGPVSHLDEWVQQDIMAMATQPPSIYDRHPLISEPIYGPVCRDGVPGMFGNQTWMNNKLALLREHCLVIWCMPPWNTVKMNLATNPTGHMPGVIQNSHTLYNRYVETMREWKGICLRYDYAKLSKQQVIAYIDKVVPTDG